MRYQLEEFYGPIVSKTGYRYDRKVSDEAAKNILELCK
jgi:hypothetical protein